MQLTPLHDRVLVKRQKNTEEKVGSIFVPDSAKEKPQQAEVIAVGPGKMLPDGSRAAMSVQAGEQVLFSKYAGSDIKVDGQTYLILSEDEILGVVE